MESQNTRADGLYGHAFIPPTIAMPSESIDFKPVISEPRHMSYAPSDHRFSSLVTKNVTGPMSDKAAMMSAYGQSQFATSVTVKQEPMSSNFEGSTAFTVLPSTAITVKTESAVSRQFDVSISDANSQCVPGSFIETSISSPNHVAGIPLTFSPTTATHSHLDTSGVETGSPIVYIDVFRNTEGSIPNSQSSSQQCKCYGCNYAFMTLGNLECHLRVVHSVIIIKGEYVCTTCSIQFSDSDGISRHLLTHSIHTPSAGEQQSPAVSLDSRPGDTSGSDKRPASKAPLATAKRKQGRGRPKGSKGKVKRAAETAKSKSSGSVKVDFFKCTCTKVFRNRERLKRHCATDCPDKKRVEFVCDTCSETFGNLKQLRTHMQTCDSLSKRYKPSRYQRKDLTCCHCNTHFVNAAILRRHELSCTTTQGKAPNPNKSPSESQSKSSSESQSKSPSRAFICKGCSKPFKNLYMHSQHKKKCRIAAGRGGVSPRTQPQNIIQTRQSKDSDHAYSPHKALGSPENRSIRTRQRKVSEEASSPNKDVVSPEQSGKKKPEGKGSSRNKQSHRCRYCSRTFRWHNILMLHQASCISKQHTDLSKELDRLISDEEAVLGTVRPRRAALSSRDRIHALALDSQPTPRSRASSVEQVEETTYTDPWTNEVVSRLVLGANLVKLSLRPRVRIQRLSQTTLRKHLSPTSIRNFPEKKQQRSQTTQTLPAANTQVSDSGFGNSEPFPVSAFSSSSESPIPSIVKQRLQGINQKYKPSPRCKKPMHLRSPPERQSNPPSLGLYVASNPERASSNLNSDRGTTTNVIINEHMALLSRSASSFTFIPEPPNQSARKNSSSTVTPGRDVHVESSEGFQLNSDNAIYRRDVMPTPPRRNKGSSKEASGREDHTETSHVLQSNSDSTFPSRDFMATQSSRNVNNSITAGLGSHLEPSVGLRSNPDSPFLRRDSSDSDNADIEDFSEDLHCIKSEPVIVQQKETPEPELTEMTTDRGTSPIGFPEGSDDSPVPSRSPTPTPKADEDLQIPGMILTCSPERPSSPYRSDRGTSPVSFRDQTSTVHSRSCSPIRFNDQKQCSAAKANSYRITNQESQARTTRSKRQSSQSDLNRPPKSADRLTEASRPTSKANKDSPRVDSSQPSTSKNTPSISSTKASAEATKPSASSTDVVVLDLSDEEDTSTPLLDTRSEVGEKSISDSEVLYRNLPCSILGSVNRSHDPENRTLYIEPSNNQMGKGGSVWLRVICKLRHKNATTAIYQCTFCVFSSQHTSLVASHMQNTHSTQLAISGGSNKETDDCRYSCFLLCRHCQYVATNEDKLWTHFFQAHDVTNRIVNKQKLDRPHDLRENVGIRCSMKRCHSLSITESRYCSTIFMHVLTTHGKSPSMVGPSFVMIECLLAKGTGWRDLYLCKNCTFSTLEKREMEVHEQTHFNKILLFVCDVCGEQCLTITRLRQHTVGKHTTVRMVASATAIDNTGCEDSSLVSYREKERMTKEVTDVFSIVASDEDEPPTKKSKKTAEKSTARPPREPVRPIAPTPQPSPSRIAMWKGPPQPYRQISPAANITARYPSPIHPQYNVPSQRGPMNKSRTPAAILSQARKRGQTQNKKQRTPTAAASVAKPPNTNLPLQVIDLDPETSPPTTASNLPSTSVEEQQNQNQTANTVNAVTNQPQVTGIQEQTSFATRSVGVPGTSSVGTVNAPVLKSILERPQEGSHSPPVVTHNTANVAPVPVTIQRVTTAPNSLPVQNPHFLMKAQEKATKQPPFVNIVSRNQISAIKPGCTRLATPSMPSTGAADSPSVQQESILLSDSDEEANKSNPQISSTQSPVNAHVKSTPTQEGHLGPSTNQQPDSFSNNTQQQDNTLTIQGSNPSVSNLGVKQPQSDMSSFAQDLLMAYHRVGAVRPKINVVHPQVVNTNTTTEPEKPAVV